MRRLLVLILLALSVTSLSATAGQPVLMRAGQKVSWEGQLTIPDPGGCDDVTSRGCVRHPLAVQAAKGAWITVGTDVPYIRVTDGSTYVASNGDATNTRAVRSVSSTVTFQQLRSGRVTYTVGVSDPYALPLVPIHFRATATLAGKAFDRQGECLVGDGGAEALLAPDDGRLLPLSVRLVSAPKDGAQVRRDIGPSVIETYRRIGVVARVSYDTMDLRGYTSYPFEIVQRRYGGVRPAGVDVVHVLSDDFTGGIAQCIGGVAYPEKSFSTGSLNYMLEAGVRSPSGSGAAIAAHEIGHLLGAQHQMSNCVEALPQLVAQPASDGSTGPCTVMSPTGVQQGPAFSTAERASIRLYVRRYARG